MTALFESFSLTITLNVFSLLIPTLLHFSRVGKPILDNNLHHSQACNIIERIFGVVNKWYSILRETNDFPQVTQANALQAQDDGQFSGGTGDIHGTETCWATEERETIAQTMWLGYQTELQRQV